MSKHFDAIIVGQGIAGTLLHYELSKRGQDVLMIDKGHQGAASYVASGLINPITGRKYVKSWMFDELFPEAKSTYEEIGELLGEIIIKNHAIVRTLSSIKDENLWHSKSALPGYKKHFVAEVDDAEIKLQINGAVSFGEVTGGAKVNMKKLINLYRSLLAKQNNLLEEEFSYEDLKNQDALSWNYKSYYANKIIFCEGWQLKHNPYFAKLGQEAAKGEVLIVKLSESKITKSIKKKIFITPLKDELYWVGSTYEWEFDDAGPTPNKKQYLIDALDEMYNGKYEIVDHWAGVRPTTIDRRPLLGSHPDYKNMFVFNGLGTKGASLGPFWAKQMVDYLLDGTKISPDVDLARYS